MQAFSMNLLQTSRSGKNYCTFAVFLLPPHHPSLKSVFLQAFPDIASTQQLMILFSFVILQFHSSSHLQLYSFSVPQSKLLYFFTSLLLYFFTSLLLYAYTFIHLYIFTFTCLSIFYMTFYLHFNNSLHFFILQYPSIFTPTRLHISLTSHSHLTHISAHFYTSTCPHFSPHRKLK
ncbi:hypothetical protein D3C76_1270380 [compost metagenome]